MNTNRIPVNSSGSCAICDGNHKCSRGDDGLIIYGRPPYVCPQGFVDLGPAKKDPQFHLYRCSDDPELQRRNEEWQGNGRHRTGSVFERHGSWWYITTDKRKAETGLAIVNTRIPQEVNR